MSHSLVSLLILTTAFLLNVQTVFACGCESRQTTLEKYRNADVVVVAKVTRLEEGPPAIRRFGDVVSASMLVEKSYKGKFKKNDELVVGQGGGIRCDWTFHDDQIGEEYLLYLRYDEKVEGLWYVWGCRTSLNLERAQDDLLYLNKRTKVLGQSRVSGFYGSDLLSYNDDLDRGNRQIKIIGRNKTYTAVTDENGVYELYGLPPGKYRLEAPIPAGFMIDNRGYEELAGVLAPELTPKNQVIFTLKRGGHEAIDVVFREDRGLRGRVFGPRGRPMLGVKVDLLNAKDFSKDDQENTDWKGRFEFDLVEPGKYVIALNLDGEKPFPTLYFPNSSIRETAELITVGENDAMRDLKIVIPTMTKLTEWISVKGIVWNSDSQLATSGIVKFEPKKTKDISAKVSERFCCDGSFSVNLLKGHPGQIYAEYSVAEGIYENCPQVDARLKKSEGKTVTIKSRPIRIDGRRDVGEIVLRFPFSGCRVSTK